MMTLRNLKIWKRRSNPPTAVNTEVHAVEKSALVDDELADQLAVMPPSSFATSAATASSSAMFRSPSSDSGYSDVALNASAAASSHRHQQVQQRHHQRNAAKWRPCNLAECRVDEVDHAETGQSSPSPVLEWPPAPPAIVLHAADGLPPPRPAPPPVDLRPNVIVLTAADKRPPRRQRNISTAAAAGDGEYIGAGANGVVVGSIDNTCMLSSDCCQNGDGPTSGGCGNWRVTNGTGNGSGNSRRSTMSVSVETFFEFVKRRDAESIRYALRDGHYDIDCQDPVGIMIKLYKNGQQ